MRRRDGGGLSAGGRRCVHTTGYISASLCSSYSTSLMTDQWCKASQRRGPTRGFVDAPGGLAQDDCGVMLVTHTECNATAWRVRYTRAFCCRCPGARRGKVGQCKLR